MIKNIHNFVIQLLETIFTNYTVHDLCRLRCCRKETKIILSVSQYQTLTWLMALTAFFHKWNFYILVQLRLFIAHMRHAPTYHGVIK